MILLVESDASCGGALARLMRRGGDRVRLVRTIRAALGAVQREPYDLAVVDLLVKGGGVDLARRLTPRVHTSAAASARACSGTSSSRPRWLPGAAQGRRREEARASRA